MRSHLPRNLFFAAACCAGAVALPGCFSPPDSFDSVDPAGRMNAASHAAAVRDESAVPELVDMLSSDDPAERMLAIATLDRLTGRRMGYDPTASSSSRQAAIDRWRQWLSSDDGKRATAAQPLGPATVPAPRTDR